MPGYEERLLALGERNRLHLLRLLMDRPLSVGELTGITGMGQSLVSHHLAVLKRADWVEAERVGRRSMYRPLGGSAVLASLVGWIRRRVEVPADWTSRIPAEEPAPPAPGSDMEDYLL